VQTYLSKHDDIIFEVYLALTVSATIPMDLEHAHAALERSGPALWHAGAIVNGMARGYDVWDEAQQVLSSLLRRDGDGEHCAIASSLERPRSLRVFCRIPCQ